jgi:hypothetical protein
MLKGRLLYPALVALTALSACSGANAPMEPPEDLGNFKLGFNYVYAGKAQTAAAVSRDIPEEQLAASLKAAIDRRLGRYNGEKTYQLGVSIEGYILARAGVPVVAAPKSAMIIRVTVYDADSKKLNEPPEQMTIIEDLDGEALLGTGWTQSADEQLAGLTQNAAKAIETFLAEQNIRQGWFMEPGYVPPPIEEEQPDSETR